MNTNGMQLSVKNIGIFESPFPLICTIWNKKSYTGEEKEKTLEENGLCFSVLDTTLLLVSQNSCDHYGKHQSCVYCHHVSSSSLIAVAQLCLAAGHASLQYEIPTM